MVTTNYQRLLANADDLAGIVHGLGRYFTSVAKFKYNYSADTAGDLSQEAYLRLYQMLESDKPIFLDEAEKLVKKTFKNLCIDHYRRMHNRIFKNCRDITECEIEDERRGPFDKLAAEEERNLVKMVLSELPIEYEEAVVLDNCGLTNNQIGEIQGSSKSTVKIRKRRSFATLKRRLSYLGVG